MTLPICFSILRCRYLRIHSNIGASESCDTFSSIDHNSIVQIKPAKILVILKVAKSSTHRSSSHISESAMTIKHSLWIVLHASLLSKYHLRPSRRAIAREATTPLIKSIATKHSVQSIAGCTGKKSASRLTINELKSLYNSAIY